MPDSPIADKFSESPIQSIHFWKKTDADGALSLRIAMGKPEAEYEVLVVLAAREIRTGDHWACDSSSEGLHAWGASNGPSILKDRRTRTRCRSSVMLSL